MWGGREREGEGEGEGDGGVTQVRQGKVRGKQVKVYYMYYIRKHR